MESFSRIFFSCLVCLAVSCVAVREQSTEDMSPIGTGLLEEPAGVSGGTQLSASDLGSDCDLVREAKLVVLAPDLLGLAESSGADTPTVRAKVGEQANPIVEIRWDEPAIGGQASLTYSLYPLGAKVPDLKEPVEGALRENLKLETFSGPYGQSLLSLDQVVSHPDFGDDEWYRVVCTATPEGDQAILATTGITKDLVVDLVNSPLFEHQLHRADETSVEAVAPDVLGLKADDAIEALSEQGACIELDFVAGRPEGEQNYVVIGARQDELDIVTLMVMPYDLAVAQGFAIVEQQPTTEQQPASSTFEPAGLVCDQSDLDQLKGFQLKGERDNIVALSADLQAIRASGNSLVSDDGRFKFDLGFDPRWEMVNWIDDGVVVSYVISDLNERVLVLFDHDGERLWETVVPFEPRAEFPSSVFQSISHGSQVYITVGHAEAIRGLHWFELDIEAGQGTLQGPFALPENTAETRGPLVFNPVDGSLLVLTDQGEIVSLNPQSQTEPFSWNYPIREVIAQNYKAILVADQENHFAIIDLQTAQATNLELTANCRPQRPWLTYPVISN